MEIKKNVLTELRDGVLIVTLNRDERRNAIDPDTANELEAIFNHAEKDPAVGALLITGAGERSFCAGEDLAALGEKGECLTETAGGLEIALACDVIVAADHARFGLTEVKVGLLATSGGLVRLPKLIPAKIASEMCLTGNLINAQRAYEVGLVNHVVPKEQVMDKAMELAKRMAANAPIPMRLAKQILHMAPHTSVEDGMRVCRYMAWKYVEGTEDAKEGPQAFLEKRPPQWKGR